MPSHRAQRLLIRSVWVFLLVVNLSWAVCSGQNVAPVTGDARVDKLLSVARPFAGRVVLAGSSMGGHVAAAAARSLNARGLFLLAPAFYMPGFEVFTPRNVGCPAVIVHGWLDDIVPVDHSIRWAHEHRATLHVLDSDHRLQDQLPSICQYLRAFLQSLS